MSTLQHIRHKKHEQILEKYSALMKIGTETAKLSEEPKKVVYSTTFVKSDYGKSSKVKQIDEIMKKYTSKMTTNTSIRPASVQKFDSERKIEEIMKKYSNKKAIVELKEYKEEPRMYENESDVFESKVNLLEHSFSSLKSASVKSNSELNLPLKSNIIAKHAEKTVDKQEADKYNTEEENVEDFKEMETLIERINRLKKMKNEVKNENKVAKPPKIPSAEVEVVYDNIVKEVTKSLFVRSRERKSFDLPSFERFAEEFEAKN